MNISSNKIAATGFATVTMDELNQLVTELGLHTIAAKEAAKYVPPALIDLVATNAAKRAVKQAINNLGKPASAKELVSFLKIYSHRWATQLICNVNCFCFQNPVSKPWLSRPPMSSCRFQTIMPKPPPSLSKRKHPTSISNASSRLSVITNLSTKGTAIPSASTFLVAK